MLTRPTIITIIYTMRIERDVASYYFDSTVKQPHQLPQPWQHTTSIPTVDIY